MNDKNPTNWLAYYEQTRDRPPHDTLKRAMYAIYAYCREIDDIADEGGTREEKRLALDGWREEISALYDGQPTRPISRALLTPLARYHLPQKPFHEHQGIAFVALDLLLEDVAPDAKLLNHWNSHG